MTTVEVAMVGDRLEVDAEATAMADDAPGRGVVVVAETGQARRTEAPTGRRQRKTGVGRQTNKFRLHHTIYLRRAAPPDSVCQCHSNRTVIGLASTHTMDTRLSPLVTNCVKSDLHHNNSSAQTELPSLYCQPHQRHTVDNCPEATRRLLLIFS